METLKPCPFCGKQPQEHYEYGSQLHGIRCVDGGKNTKHVLISSYGYTPEEAVISWNTRHEAAKIPDQPDEYTGLVEKLELMHCPINDDAWEEMLGIIKEHMEARDIAQPGRAAHEGSTQFKSAPIPEKYNQVASAITPKRESGAYPECSGDPSSCPENDGYGCCKPKSIKKCKHDWRCTGTTGHGSRPDYYECRKCKETKWD